MKPNKFAVMMEGVGFRADEPVVPIFELNRTDLKNPVFKEGYSKVIGKYRVVSIWLQSGEVAFWAQASETGTKLFPFSKKEVDYLSAQAKFRKN